MMHWPRKGWRPVVGLVAAVGVLAAACGNDDDATTDTTEPPAADDAADAGDDTAGDDELAVEVEGCENGFTDPADLSEDRAVARCEPSAPAPQPLPETETVRMSSAFRLEFNSPILLAERFGEFEAENIDFEFVDLGFSDAVPSMTQGDLDAAVGGVEAALFNAGNQDLGIKMVIGNFWPPDAGDFDVPQTGLWCRADAFGDPDDPDFTEVADMRIGSAVGVGSAAIYYSAEMLERRTGEPIDLTQADVEQVPSAEMVLAMENEAIDCAILLDPVWTEVQDDPDFVLAATQTPGEPLGGVFFGPSLLEERRDVGVAFLRAIIRTINTHFDGDYHADEEVVAAIADEIDQPVENVTRTPALLMDWEIRQGTTDRVQELFIALGVLTEFDDPIDEDVIVDRSLYLEAVGAE